MRKAHPNCPAVRFYEYECPIHGKTERMVHFEDRDNQICNVPDRELLTREEILDFTRPRTFCRERLTRLWHGSSVTALVGLTFTGSKLADPMGWGH